jgi:hypothetical protein
VSVVAAIRPDDWNFPLLLHVLGAMLLVGALVLTASALIFAWRNGNAALVRLGFRSLLLGVIPAWIVMRVSAEWIADKENLTGDDVPNWIDIGYMTADTGLLLIIVATVLGGFAARRAAGAEASGGGLRRASTVVVSLLLIASLVSVWAMTTKPT